MAAINFPSSPSNGDVHTENGATYEYETSTTSWLKVPSTWINDGSYVYYDGALNVGIGTTTPSTKLHVVGTTLLAGETDVTGDFAVNTDALWVNASNGRVGIGTVSPAVTLAIQGTDAVLLTVGTTAQRPAGLTGMIRFNSTNDGFEGYTSAWGAIGDVTASSLATVATSGDYTDLISLPTLGTAAATAITDYATSAQGTSADTAFGWGDHDAAGYLPLTGGTMTGQLTSPNINLTGFLNFTGTGTSLIYSNDGGEDIEIRVNNSQSATATDLLLRGRGANDTITTTIGNTIVSQITSTGLVVTGTVDATSYTGDGSALTGISGGGGGGGITWELKTTTYTAVANDGIIADTSGGIWTLTLPATPATGDVVQLVDGADWNANNLTVARNGETIESVASDLIMDVGNIAVDLIFDGTTWQVTSQASGYSGEAVTTTGIQTLTNKTMDDVALTGKVTEAVFVITGTTPELDPANGTMTTWVLSGASTPTFAATWAQGESMLILIDDGSANTITWPSMLWAGGVEPTLATSGYSAITIFKLGANIFGIYAGDFS
jgi:hypothetical protein